jgi:hypothetical protein
MPQTVFEIAGEFLAGDGDHGPISVDAIALDAFICINTKWSDGNQHEKHNEKKSHLLCSLLCLNQKMAEAGFFGYGLCHHCFDFLDTYKPTNQATTTTR